MNSPYTAALSSIALSLSHTNNKQRVDSQLSTFPHKDINEDRTTNCCCCMRSSSFPVCYNGEGGREGATRPTKTGNSWNKMSLTLRYEPRNIHTHTTRMPAGCCNSKHTKKLNLLPLPPTQHNQDYALFPAFDTSPPHTTNEQNERAWGTWIYSHVTKKPVEIFLSLSLYDVRINNIQPCCGSKIQLLTGILALCACHK